MSLRDYIDLERGEENINRVNIQVFWPKNKKKTIESLLMSTYIITVYIVNIYKRVINLVEY